MRVGRIFYFDKREREIYDDFLKNMECMLDGVKLMEKSVREIRGKEHEKDISKAIEYELVCDTQSFHITEKILGIKSHGTRYDLLRLNQSLEKISKAIEGTSRRIQMSKGIELPDYLNNGLGKMAKATVETVEALEEVVRVMPFDSEKTLEKIKAVHEKEEKMDDVRRKSCYEFLHSKKPIAIQKYYIWQAIVDKMESAADRCEESSDIIKRIIASKD